MARKKLKPLLPSLKERKRYLAFRIHSKSQIRDFKAVRSQIKASFVQFFGEMGLANAGLRILSERWSEKKQTGIIRVSHKMVNELKSALLFITSIKGQDVIIQSLGVSGMIHIMQEKHIGEV